MKNSLLIFAVILLFATACKKDNQSEEELLQIYLSENNITQDPTDSGMYYIETKAGTGAQAKAGQKVSVHYEGRLTDGTVFDSSYDRGPFEFTLGTGQVIAGWDEGIAYMKEGGKAQLIIPSALGYGSQAVSVIPANSTLIFEVELVDAKK